jgi:hypothetical protein
LAFYLAFTLTFYLEFVLTFSLSGSGGARADDEGAGHADIKSRDPHLAGGGRQKQYSNVCICIYKNIIWFQNFGVWGEARAKSVEFIFLFSQGFGHFPDRPKASIQHGKGKTPRVSNIISTHQPYFMGLAFV